MLLLSLREEGAHVCFIHTRGQTQVFSPNSNGPSIRHQHNTAMLAAVLPQAVFCPYVLMPAKPWVYTPLRAVYVMLVL